MSDWNKMIQWELVLPPNRPSNNDLDRINKILEIPISNLNIMIDLTGYINLLDICKEQFFKFNFFNSDLPYDGYIGKITEIDVIKNNRCIQYETFIPFLVD